MLTLPNKLQVRALVLILYSGLSVLLTTLLIQPVFAAPEITQSTTSELDQIPWQSGDKLPTWSTRQSQGGKFSSLIGELPNHWRRFGPGTPNALTPILESLNIPLLGQHPQTNDVIPMLASHWYHDINAQRFYYRIDDRALWSDGIPVTSADIAFTLFFLTDPQRMTPYQKQLIEKVITGITIYDPSHFSLGYSDALDNTPNGHSLLYSFRPMPAHHYQSGRQWVRARGPESIPEPVTGPYKPTSLTEDSVKFERIELWWGDHQRYFENRFTLSEITLIEYSARSFKRFAEGSIDGIQSNDSSAMSSTWLNKIAKNYQISRASVELESPEQVLLITNSVTPNTKFQALADQLILLHKTLGNSDQNQAEIINLTMKLIYPAGSEFNWLNRANNAQGLSPDHYRNAIQTGNYEAALLIAPSPAITSAQRPFSLSLADKSVAVIYDIPYHHYAYWDWVGLPTVNVAKGRTDWFSPFDATRGGLISIDRKRKAKTLDKPTRSNKDIPGVTLYPANPTKI